MREYGVAVDWPEVTYAPIPGLPQVTVPEQHCELGLEVELLDYVGHLVHVFRQIRRPLRLDGTVWLNLGDGWASAGKRGGTMKGFNERWYGHGNPGKQTRTHDQVPSMNVPHGLKRKDLIGVPWRVALALQADGWWLRSEVIWEKPNALPDPTEDRPTRCHETIFHLARQEHYFHDAHAIREAHTMTPQRRPNGHKRRRSGSLLPEHTWSGTARAEPGVDGHFAGRNARSIWTISTTPFQEAHFAVMPLQLADRCVLASTSERGVCPACGAPHLRVVERASDRAPFSTSWKQSCGCDPAEPVPAMILDPFSGSGTTGIAAMRRGRNFVGVEINESYAEMSQERIGSAIGRLFEPITPEPAPIEQTTMFGDEPE